MTARVTAPCRGAADPYAGPVTARRRPAPVVAVALVVAGVVLAVVALVLTARGGRAPGPTASVIPVSQATVDPDAYAEQVRQAADVVAAWLASPGHRANILDPALTRMTVACVHDGDQMLCSQLFAGP